MRAVKGIGGINVQPGGQAAYHEVYKLPIDAQVWPELFPYYLQDQTTAEG
jgi:hypothetical protein